MDAIKIKYDKFKKDLDKNAYLSKIEKITKIPKEYAVIGSILVVCILLFFRIGAGLICNLAGFIYPTYRSFKAIESTSSSDDTQWLVYWVFYAAFSIIDTFIDFLLQWIPFYYFFKLGFLIWSFHPSTQGASWIYGTLLKKFIATAEDKIDEAFKAKQKTTKTKAEDIPPPIPVDSSTPPKTD
mmetsp:Transcript_27763/g.35905  ORF Transcript_27763/g.35905 Transcript_27763/m.35905 type:complete len:183 (+) Transcript_27763:245-793(+)